MIVIIYLRPEDDSVFLRTPFALLDAGVQVIEPSLAALLAYPSRKSRRNHRPFHLLREKKQRPSNTPHLVTRIIHSTTPLNTPIFTRG